MQDCYSPLLMSINMMTNMTFTDDRDLLVHVLRNVTAFKTSMDMFSTNHTKEAQHFTYSDNKENLDMGGHIYVIILLSIIVVLAILFTMFGLLNKAEAHSKSDLTDTLLFKNPQNDVMSSYFEARSTTSLI